MKNLILWISLLLNFALYTGIIDSMEYKKLVNSSLQTGKNIITNEKLKDIWTVITTEINNWIWKDLKDLQVEKTKSLQK